MVGCLVPDGGSIVTDSQLDIIWLTVCLYTFSCTWSGATLVDPFVALRASAPGGAWLELIAGHAADKIGTVL